MAFWDFREEICLSDRLRRSYYKLLRDELDQFILKYALVDSYNKFSAQKIPYPFVERRELKPRALIPNIEYGPQNAFLVMFLEDDLPEIHKKYIRFFNDNKTTKVNLLKTKSLPLTKKYGRNQKYLESAKFFDFLKDLLPVDYALLIKRDPTSIAKARYALSHYHVRIDWPIADAAEDLARHLRYISKDLYEKGDKYAEVIQKKFFEYYGLPAMAGGRRTAAIVAAQFFKRIPCLYTIYAGSSESRALIRISERGVAKSILIKFSKKEIAQISDAKKIPIQTFKKNYAITHNNKQCICIFQATCSYTEHAKPPDDGKLRELKTDPYWLTVGAQQILPKPGIWKFPPLSYNVIYS
ncbi:MAG: hypothetical protein KAH06_01845 [Desulfobacterales bacterium]|nr:hypothetical protein [Desulfobacterales bacterium]